MVPGSNRRGSIAAEEDGENPTRLPFILSGGGKMRRQITTVSLVPQEAHAPNDLIPETEILPSHDPADGRQATA
jgi:hypothetical protein